MTEAILNFVFFSVFFMGSAAHARELFPVELIRMTSVGYEPFMSTKSTTISVFRVPIAARYLIKAEPLGPNMEPHVPAELYSCLDHQLKEIKTSLSAKDFKVPPRLILIVISESWSEAGTNVCSAMAEFLSEGKLVIQTCMDVYKSFPESCRPVKSADITKNYQQKDMLSQRKKESHSAVMKTAKEVLNLMGQ